MRTVLVAGSCLVASVLSGEICSARDTAGPDRDTSQRAKAARTAQPETSAPGGATNATAALAPSASAPVTTAASAAPSEAAPGATEALAPASDGASPTPAPDAAEGARTEEAKRLYGLGAEAFAARRNVEAIRYFRRAAALVPSPKLTYNIALAYEELGDLGRAIAEYRDYLRHETEAARADEVRPKVAELERELGATGVQLLTVSSHPRGAVVKIGGEPVGVTPWIGEPPLGAHDVSVELRGHEVRRARVLLAPDRSYELDVTLTPQPPAEPALERASLEVRPLTWTFLGVGAGAVAGGLAFELSRAKSSERAARSDSPLQAAEARGAADAKQMASLLLLGSGTAFLIGGGVLLALDLGGAGEKTPASSASATSARVSAPCAVGFCGVLAEGSF